MPQVKEERIAQGLNLQDKFFILFNALDPDKYHLVKSNQEYEIFDFFLFKTNEIEPYLIELKTRPGKFHDTFNDTLIDYIKIIKLRSMSKRAFVIVCYEDLSVVVDVSQNPDGLIVGQYDNMEKPVALYEVSKLKTLPISLEALRAIK